MTQVATVWVVGNSTNNVKKIDAITNSVLATITVGTAPYGICWDGVSAVWVANSGTNTVSKIDTATGAIVATVNVGTFPQGMCLDDRGFVWVGNANSGTLSKIDPITNTVVATVTLGPGGFGTNTQDICSGGGYVFTADYATNVVSKVDPVANVVVATCPLANHPRGVVYQAGFVWASRSTAGVLAKIDATTMTVVDTVTVSDTPLGLITDGTNIWVAITSTSHAKKIDPVGDTVLATIGVDNDPDQIAYDPLNGNVWIVNQSSNSVTKVNATTNAVLASIGVGSSPWGVCVSIFTPPVRSALRRVIKQRKFSMDLVRGRVRRSLGKSIPFFSWTEIYTQGFRIENTSLAIYELYVGENAPVDFSAPVATSPTLPFSWTPSLPSSGTAVYNVVVRQKNRFDMESFNVFATTLKFVAHVPVVPPVHAPQNVIVYDDVSGYIRVIGKYLSVLDPVTPADSWELYVKFGSDPVPGVDTPVFVGPMTFVGAEAGIVQLAGPYSPGTIAHVILVALRTGDSSRGAAAVILHELAVDLNLSEGFLFGGNTFEDQ